MVFKYFSLWGILCLVGFSLVGCAEEKSNELISIEDSNAYTWQKYMNEKEFNQLIDGMNYMDVVNIAGGVGELQQEGVFIWYDEMSLTQAYEIQFKKDQLISKKIIEVRGYSTR
ncbi:hypothetical protein [Solibacillus sp. CAU 1738]|uniref:hypothetical protein n=1 Tax=Solibacillus sp. CAU 1738 TaxID=3140363 RepID=UPI00326159CD